MQDQEKSKAEPPKGEFGHFQAVSTTYPTIGFGFSVVRPINRSVLKKLHIHFSCARAVSGSRKQFENEESR
jgi:hypothetical protein